MFIYFFPIFVHFLYRNVLFVVEFTFPIFLSKQSRNFTTVTRVATKLIYPNKRSSNAEHKERKNVILVIKSLQ